MAQYISGSKLVLDHMLASPYSTQGFSYSGLAVIDANARRHALLPRTPGSPFDRVVQFFQGPLGHRGQVDDLARRGPGVLEGQGGQPLWHLLDELKTNYNGYVSQLAAATTRRPTARSAAMSRSRS